MTPEDFGIELYGSLELSKLQLDVDPAFRSAIVAGQPYFVSDPINPDPLYGEIAPYTRRNYYKELRKKLESFAKYLKREFGARSYLSINGRLAEKPLALAAGLGYSGNHSIIINRKYGSRILLGVLLTDQKLTYVNAQDLYHETDCGGCDICMRSCPTSAILAPRKIDRHRCLQYISQNSEPHLELLELWGRKLYGCDICQDVCPKNRAAVKRKDFPNYADLGAYIYIPELLYMSDSEIKEKFKGNQLGASWVPPVALIKNGLFVLSQTPEGLKYVKQFASIGREELRWLAMQILKMRGSHEIS